MRAVCWFGPHDVRVENVPDPQIVNPHDAVVKITSTAICGSDLHLYDGYIPTWRVSMDTPARVSSAILTSMADMPVDRQSMHAFPLPMLGRSRFPKG